jgi:hypothetical protein
LLSVLLLAVLPPLLEPDWKYLVWLSDKTSLHKE